MYEHDKANAPPGQEPVGAPNDGIGTPPPDDDTGPENADLLDAKREVTRLAELLEHVSNTRVRGGERAKTMWEASRIWSDLPWDRRLLIETRVGFNKSAGLRAFPTLAAKVIGRSKRTIQRDLRYWDLLIEEARGAWLDKRINGEDVKTLLDVPRSAQRATLDALCSTTQATDDKGGSTGQSEDE